MLVSFHVCSNHFPTYPHRSHKLAHLIVSSVVSPPGFEDYVVVKQDEVRSRSTAASSGASFARHVSVVRPIIDAGVQTEVEHICMGETQTDGNHRMVAVGYEFEYVLPERSVQTDIELVTKPDVQTQHYTQRSRRILRIGGRSASSLEMRKDFEVGKEVGRIRVGEGSP